jgi:predicted metal-binding membrane protein
MAQARLADRHLFVPLVAILAALSWLALWSLGASHAGAYLHHAEVARAGIVGLVIAVVGWVLMTAAMMLPTTVPLVRLFERVTVKHPERVTLMGLLLSGYLLVWTTFGLAVYLGDLGVHALVERTAWLDSHAWSITATTVAGAGAYQFSKLKYRCLDQCRSPLMFVTERWTGRDERARSFRIGIDHGIFCVGCCWFLMLVLFAVGVGNHAWMFGAGALMAVEKNLPCGRRLSTPLGIALIVSALVLLLRNLL